MEVDDLMLEQAESLDKLERSFVNRKKKGGWNTKGNIESRLKLLEEKWSRMQSAHDVIVSRAKAADKKKEYFVNDFMESASEDFADERAKFLDALETLASERATSNPPRNPAKDAPEQKIRKLPVIPLPTFSGKYTEWPSFRDRFTSIIASYGNLTDIDRLDYLVSCLQDDAKKCVQSLGVQNGNYATVWDRLKERYDNERAVITACLNDLFQLKAISTESSAALKILRDGTREAIDHLSLLHRPVDKWDDILVHLTVVKMDPQSRRDWETQLGTSINPPTFKELDDFLYTRIRALESYEQCNQSQISPFQPQSNTKGKKPSGGSAEIHAHATTQLLECSHCKENHYIVKCKKFNALNLQERKSFAESRRLCYNCLGQHMFRDCQSLKRCTVTGCRGRHHTLLHDPAHHGIPPSENHEQELHSHDSVDTVNAPTASARSVAFKSAWLATARVTLKTSSAEGIELRALIDPCSEASFIAESAVRRLGLSRKPVFTPVSGIGGARDRTARSRINFTFTSAYAIDREWNVDALELPCLTDYLPTRRRLENSLSLLEGLDLADPHLESEDPIEILLGIDVFPKIIEEGLRKSSDESLIAQKTAISWILSGTPGATRDDKDSQNPNISTFQCSIDLDLSASLQRFFDQEEAEVPQLGLLSSEEQQCEEHFSKTTKRYRNGRFIVQLPLKRPKEELGNSFPAAKAMLLSMERRFARDPKLFKLHQEFMDEYHSLGHMRSSPRPESDEEMLGFYLPHHGVFKTTGDSTKLRVVFNGSVKLPSGRPLNDRLHVGQKLQNDPVDILLRWRMHCYVFSADIVKAFRQIKVAEKDQQLQKILWRNSLEDEIETYLLTVVTYGLASSPYQTNRCIRQLAIDERPHFPKAAKILEEDTYVDDTYGGAETLSEALEIQEELQNILKCGGFPLREWAANDPQLLQNFNPEDLAASISIDMNNEKEHQVLGISWNPNADVFNFHLSSCSVPGQVTKRSVLSLIARLYDPLGWVSPIIMLFKVFMKALWKLEQGWDDPLPHELQRRWNALESSLGDINLISVPRWVQYKSSCRLIEIHGFADASNEGYGAVVYLKIVTQSLEVSSNLLISKTKVAPPRAPSIARLELCGAELLTKLVQRVLKALSVKQIKVHLWLDSIIALCWIKADPSRWKTYVSNRVYRVQSRLPRASWHYINKLQNPADLASRGTSPKSLNESELWFFGPEFIRSTSESWPEGDFTPTTSCNEEARVNVHIGEVNSDEWELVL